MGTKDKRVDAYIGTSQEFAKPILKHLRATVHKACPDVEEKMKWSFPHFDYKGMMCSMAAFKEHAVFGFWKASLLKDPKKVLEATGENSAMGHFGRLTSVNDLPSQAVLVRYIREAAALNDQGVLVKRAVRPARKNPKAPAVLVSALSKNPKARITFEHFPPGQKREYIDWIAEAKTEETRARRLANAIEWMAEGKPRNWKYMKR